MKKQLSVNFENDYICLIHKNRLSREIWKAGSICKNTLFDSKRAAHGGAGVFARANRPRDYIHYYMTNAGGPSASLINGYAELLLIRLKGRTHPRHNATTSR